MSQPPGLQSVENARGVVGQWTESLAQVLESMTDLRPATQWQAMEGNAAELAGPDAEILWWQQPFQVAPGAVVWVGAPKAVWEHCGTLTLKAAGLDTVDPGEARNTWFEILGQSLGVMARAIGAAIGSEVTCEPGSEAAPDPAIRQWAVVQIAFPETQLPAVLAALSPRLLEVLAAPPAHEEAPLEPAAVQPARASDGAASRTMELLLEVDLPISISFGKARLPMKDVLKLTTGSIVELNRGVNEPVEVLVNQCLIARGEVVVVEGNYGVRIQEIASRQDRLRSIR